MNIRFFSLLLGEISALVISMGISRFAYTPLLPLMQHDISFSNIVSGYIASINYAEYLLGCILTGNRTIFLKINIVISILTTAFMGVSDFYLLWFLIRFIAGISSAFIYVLEHLSALTMIFQAIGIIAPVFRTSSSGIMISAILFGATFMGIPTLGTTLVNLMNQSKSESIIGYFTAVYATGQIIGPIIAGFLALSNNNYNISLIGAAVIVLIGACLLLTGVKFEIKPSVASKE